MLPKEDLDESAVQRLQKAIPQAKIERVEGYALSFNFPSSPSCVGVAEDAFWTGDYPRFEHILSHWMESPRHTWLTMLWLGHAHWLQGDRHKAAEAYHRAIEELISHPAPPITGDHTYQQHSQQLSALVRFVSDFELRELSDPSAAAKTLLRARSHDDESDDGDSDDTSSPKEPPSQPEAAPSAARKVEAIGPFEAVPLDLPGFGSARLADASLVVLPDGRRLMAFTGKDAGKPRGIMLTTSADGRHWDRPWSFPHNIMFECAHPSLVIEGGEIWMFYGCNHFPQIGFYSYLGSDVLTYALGRA